MRINSGNSLIPVDQAWLITAEHRTKGDNLEGYSFVGLLDHQISGQAMLIIIEKLYEVYAQQQLISTSDAIDKAKVSFVHLNDGSACEDWVVCWGKSPVSLKAVRAHNVSFFYQEGATYVKWRLQYLIVNGNGVRETDFWETLGLSVNGISELISFDED